MISTKVASEFEKLKNIPCQDCENPGKQGIVKIVTIKDREYIAKFSKYIDYLIRHESAILKGLSEILPFCPHFCEYYGTVVKKVDKNYRKAENPYKIVSGYPIEQEVMLMEYIKGIDFHIFMKNRKNKDDAVFSIIRQTMLAISIAQKEKKFVHYDLHPSNVLIRKCDKNDVYLYVLNEDIQFAVPTYGNYASIIDVGFGYIEDIENNPVYCTLAHTNYGFTSCIYDEVADPKLFLVTSSDVFRCYRKNENSKVFRNIVRNIFKPLDIGFSTGWDNAEDSYSALDYIRMILNDKSYGSKLFKNQSHFCIELIQVLIDIPIKKKDVSECEKNLKLSYKVLVKEFLIIENQIGSSFFSLYVFKNIIGILLKIKKEYLNKKTRKDAVKKFGTELYTILEKVTKFCNPKGLNLEKLICSILTFAQSMEGILYDNISTRMKEKRRMYKKLELQNTLQIYGALEVNLPDSYEYTEKSNIHIWDSENKTHSIFKLTSKQADKVNKLESIVKGTYIYDLYKKTNKDSEESESSDDCGFGSSSKEDVKKNKSRSEEEEEEEVQTEEEEVQTEEEEEVQTEEEVRSDKGNEASSEKEEDPEESSDNRSSFSKDSSSKAEESAKSSSKSQDEESSQKTERSTDESSGIDQSEKDSEETSKNEEILIEDEDSKENSQENLTDSEQNIEDKSEKSKTDDSSKDENKISVSETSKSSEKIPKKRTKKSDVELASKKQCSYIFKKGKDKGKRCEKKTLKEFCSQHDKA